LSPNSEIIEDNDSHLKLEEIRKYMKLNKKSREKKSNEKNKDKDDNYEINDYKYNNRSYQTQNKLRNKKESTNENLWLKNLILRKY
jgi:predicted S18 family serine protease